MIWRSACVATVLTLSACGVAPASAIVPTVAPTPSSDEVLVSRVIDGDTIVTTSPNGVESKVRLIGIDSAETKKPGAPIGCWGPEASAFAEQTLNGKIVRLVADPTQDDADRYGRLLRYVELADGRDFSVLAARVGAARSYVYDNAHPPQRIAAIQAAERSAVNAHQGLWSAACLTRPTK